MAVLGLSQSETGQILNIFNDENFVSSLSDGKEKDSHRFISSVENNKLKVLFVLTHEAASPFFGTGDLRQERKTYLNDVKYAADMETHGIKSLGNEFEKPAINAKAYIEGKSDNVEAVFIAEVPAQRIAYHEVARVSSSLKAFPDGETLVNGVSGNITSHEELEALMDGIGVSKMGGGLLDLSTQVSFGEKVWLSFCHTLMLVEAVWRTFAESVMYLVHWMMKDQFEADGYSLVERKEHLQRQWQSTILVAGAIWNPVGILADAERLRNSLNAAGERFVAMDTLDDVQRGTPYAGKLEFTTSGLTSDVWKRV